MQAKQHGYTCVPLLKIKNTHMNNKLIATTCIFIAFVTFLKSSGQTAGSIPKIYIGFAPWMGGADPSGTLGLELEYRFITKTKLTLGAKAAYSLPYENGNMDFNLSSSNPLNVPYKLSHAELLFTGNFFLTKKEKQGGFFLTGATGLIYTAGKTFQTWVPASVYYSINPSVEGGFGIHFIIAKKYAVEWSNTLQYASLQNHDFKNSNSGADYGPFNRLIMMGTKLSFGF
jgi:hypothetical protein